MERPEWNGNGGRHRFQSEMETNRTMVVQNEESNGKQYEWYATTYADNEPLDVNGQ